VLIESGSPSGGKWTFDTENRRKIPASVYIPPLNTLPRTPFISEAIEYVEHNFEKNYGHADKFNYPVTRDQAVHWLESFLTERFVQYGIYQDAIVNGSSFLFHSVLTPALNIGLLTPDHILERTLDFARHEDVPLNSVEGFVRQILGWREFIRGLYALESVHQRTRNVWNHHNSIPSCFWNGTTGIEPIDDVVNKVLKTAYSNHIERLMVIGNFMLLCEFHPNQVYEWFMTLYIDAYDWVMVPNVYGMSQFSDGGLMSTKPYISGSNYILKMSNYKKGEWCEVWDSLYWNFIEKHQEIFIKNPRMSMMVRQFHNMETSKKKRLRETREKFMSNLRIVS
jgi:deoxyribodipyrimidine photolyase-related protein